MNSKVAPLAWRHFGRMHHVRPIFAAGTYIVGLHYGKKILAVNDTKCILFIPFLSCNFRCCLNMQFLFVLFQADVTNELEKWDTSKVREELLHDMDAHIVVVREAKLNELARENKVSTWKM